MTIGRDALVHAAAYVAVAVIVAGHALDAAADDRRASVGGRRGLLLTPTRAYAVRWEGWNWQEARWVCDGAGHCARITSRRACTGSDCPKRGVIFETDGPVVEVRPLGGREALQAIADAASYLEPGPAKPLQWAPDEGAIAASRTERLDGFMDPQAGRDADRAGAPVEWWEERPWRWEASAGGGLTWLETAPQELALHGGADARAGFRYQRRPRAWHAGYLRGFLGGLTEVLVGDQYGADARFRWLGDGAWVVGLDPVSAICFPGKGSTRVAFRSTSLLGLVLPEVGIGDPGTGTLAAHLRFDLSFSLLVFPHAGVELSGGWGTFVGTTPRAFDIGFSLGVFVR